MFGPGVSTTRRAAPAKSKRSCVGTIDASKAVCSVSVLASPLAQVLGSSGKRRVGEIGEQAVQAERVVLQVFLLRVAVVARRQPAALVAEREGMDEQAGLVRV